MGTSIQPHQGYHGNEVGYSGIPSNQPKFGHQSWGRTTDINYKWQFREWEYWILNDIDQWKCYVKQVDILDPFFCISHQSPTQVGCIPCSDSHLRRHQTWQGKSTMPWRWRFTWESSGTSKQASIKFDWWHWLSIKIYKHHIKSLIIKNR